MNRCHCHSCSFWSGIRENVRSVGEAALYHKEIRSCSSTRWHYSTTMCSLFFFFYFFLMIPQIFPKVLGVKKLTLHIFRLTILTVSLGSFLSESESQGFTVINWHVSSISCHTSPNPKKKKKCNCLKAITLQRVVRKQTPGTPVCRWRRRQDLNSGQDQNFWSVGCENVP